MAQNDLLQILQTEIKPAIGCTEPVAVALAAAKAKDLLKEEIIHLEVKVDPNIYKNGMGVYVPGTKEKGLAFAAALGAVGGKAQLELEVLKDITAEHIYSAGQLISSSKVSVSYIPNHIGVYVEVIAKSLQHQAKVIISNTHTNIIYQELDGQILLDNRDVAGSNNAHDLYKGKQLTINTIIDNIDNLQAGQLNFLENVIKINKEIAQFGLKAPVGMAVGYKWYKLIEQGVLANDIINIAKAYTAAATDARMSGESLPVMSCAGSGNQGLMASLPVIVAADFLNVSKETLFKALAISFLTTIYVKIHIGRLSAICGCAVAASPGAGAGIGYLLNLDKQGLVGTINNIIGDIAGMICDGAKPGCSLKMTTAVDAAVQMALLAKNKVIIEAGSGIVSNTAEASIENIGILSKPGMLETDRTILNIMEKKFTCNDNLVS